ncbi:PKD domain-containing protein [Ancylomarina sp. 16SWW S1-10-2]|uniref:PKD domain-containing protein n=1 Tax=Ancylomarina sp. 16SWW S1-10-2 TaxID=2499681 RepID=UPI001E3A42EE|nr:PKD domain-containing protein [Ancylomarina sp. 16SWW S1-10-2]
MAINAYGQDVNYRAHLAPFCKYQDDEFSPIFFKNGIVYCSNTRQDLFFTFSTPENKELFNMFFVPIKHDSIQVSPKPFSTELMTNFNDGPAAFAKNDSMIIYSRNTMVDSKKRDHITSGNMLGLFISYIEDGVWMEPEPFFYNSDAYHLTMPTLNSEGTQLIFASDMPGGFGGLDLYYSEKTGNFWTEPLNLGDKINTKENDCYPFLSDNDILFFASKGHNSIGGLDIFYSKQENMVWTDLVHLSSPINTQFDDFGLITDVNFEDGYFSTNRNGRDDIFKFETKYPQFINCDSLKENEYCFLFYDENSINLDASKSHYEWDFGNDIKLRGKEVTYCFDGPGDYHVKLNIINTETDAVFLTQSTYDFEIRDYEQAYISCVDKTDIEKEVVFDAFKTNLPNFKVSEYYWDLGNDIFKKGSKVTNRYTKPGRYKITLGLRSEKDSLGRRDEMCMEKYILIRDPNKFKHIEPNLIRVITDHIKLPNIDILDDLPKQLIPFKNNINIRYFNYSNDMLDNPALALSLESERAKNRETSIKFKKVEQDLRLLSDSFKFAYIDLELNNIEDKGKSIIYRLAQLLLANPKVEIKVALHVHSSDRNRFDEATKTANTLVEYLVMQGVESNRLRSAVFGISNNKKGVPTSAEYVSFELVKE